MDDDRDEPGTEQRACGPCSGCCYIGGVPSLDKQAYEECAHARVSGCVIYSARPSECRDYNCLWLEGEFDAGDRPDLIGVAFDLPDLIRDHPHYAGVPVICMRELTPGARDGVRATNLVLQLTRKFVVRITHHGGRVQIVGPESLVSLLSARAHAQRPLPRAPDADPGSLDVRDE